MDEIERIINTMKDNGREDLWWKLWRMAFGRVIFKEDIPSAKNLQEMCKAVSYALKSGEEYRPDEVLDALDRKAKDHIGVWYFMRAIEVKYKEER